ncbi:tumor protein D52 isoform X1 [Brachyhypopomus gauderio]|uniref:tumor protein D52 isoform X1 n=1 Tax=Brachyhypopomus gauderio TaxID=698409 RepID=UPI00404213AF
MEDSEKGIPGADGVAEVGEDAANSADQTGPNEVFTAEEQEELRTELAKVEEEIQTLSQVLASKEKQVAEIKRKLGITPLNELRQNLSKGWQEVTTSTAYRKTSETLSQAGQKATAAFSSVGTAITRKLEDVRNTPTFKSFEEKVDTLKTKMSPEGSSSELGDVSHPVPNAEPMLEQPEVMTAHDPEPH